MGSALQASNLRRAGGARYPSLRWRCGVAAVAGLAIGVATGLADAAGAECLLQPDAAAPDGSHWSLHTDPATNRRCWVMVDNTGRAAAPPPPAATAAAPPASTLGSFLGSLMPSSSPPPPAAAEPVPEPPPVQPRRTPPRAVTAAPRPAAAQLQKPSRPDLTPEQREELFAAFMRWHDSQQQTDGQAAQPKDPSRDHQSRDHQSKDQSKDQPR